MPINTTGGEVGASAKQRKYVSTACQPCRKRKSRCDGRRPCCSVCKVHKTAELCFYEPESDKRRQWGKAYGEQIQRRLVYYEGLVNSIRNASEAELPSVIHKIRSVDFTPPAFSEASEEKEALLPNVSQIMGDLQLDEEGELHFYGATSNLNLLPSPGIAVSPPGPSVQTPSAARYLDTELIDHLLDVYWTWQHKYFMLLDKDIFLRDMKTGGKYYSDLLLMAILAHASHLSDRAGLRSDPDDPATAGYFFYNKALADLNATVRPSITIVQACILLASRDAGVGRQSRGWMSSGMAFRMALDLGLHIDCSPALDRDYLTQEDLYVRSLTFWGCYVFDQGWAAYIGRPSLISTDIITVPKPLKVEHAPSDPDLPVFCAIIDLTEILGKVVDSLYQPTILKQQCEKPNTKANILEFHAKLNSWKTEHTPILRDSLRASPAVMTMHILYHTVVILLFRPFIRDPGLPEYSGIPSPRLLASQSANEIASLLQAYRDLYTLRKCTNLLVHLAFTAATIFVLESDLPALQTLETLLSEIAESWSSANIPRKGIAAFFQSRGVFLDTDVSPVTKTAALPPELAFLDGTGGGGSNGGFMDIGPGFQEYFGYSSFDFGQTLH